MKVYRGEFIADNATVPAPAKENPSTAKLINLYGSRLLD
jgi:hypothetical protein